MIEVIIDGKTARERLFDTYHRNKNQGRSVITPKNDEIRKYCKFLKSYHYNKDANYINEYFVMKIDNNCEKLVNYSPINDDEKFLFEFPDYYPEEELFYFKLKYC